jgi:Zn-dependent peptidase ImmA (M78 family)/DNA-binding XRE family transcriptional regulator
LTSETDFDSIDPHALAEALRKARKAWGLTQADAAKVIGAARTTITAIEKGERQVKADELIALAQAYGRQVSDFVRPRPAIESFRDRFKTVPHPLGPDDEWVNADIDAFEEICRNYLELEKLTGTTLSKDYPLPYDIEGIDPEAAAEDVATAERNRLGLGEAPIPNLREVLEVDVGLRIFNLPIRPREYASFYLFSDDLGGSIALNAQDTEERQLKSLAQQYGHFLAYRFRPAILADNFYERRPERRRFVENFAEHFLMPSSSLKRRFNSLRRSNRSVTAAELGVLSHYYGVSLADLTRRFEALNLLPSGVWDRISEGGYKIREETAEYTVEVVAALDNRLPIRYRYLAILAYDKGSISEGQLAGFLGTDRLQARRMAEEIRSQASSELGGRLQELDLTRVLTD